MKDVWLVKRRSGGCFCLRTLLRAMLSLGKIGDITKAIFVIAQFEHKMIS
jgi:hypothetical protein